MVKPTYLQTCDSRDSSDSIDSCYSSDSNDSSDSSDSSDQKTFFTKQFFFKIFFLAKKNFTKNHPKKIVMKLSNSNRGETKKFKL